jgi:hypothetical protein
MRTVLSFGVICGCFLTFACSGGAGSDASDGGGTNAGGSSPGGAGGSGSHSNGTGGTGISISTGGTGTGSAGTGGSGGFDPNSACVANSAEGERLPVDLYFMVDITGSMNCPVPDSPSAPCEVDPGAPYSSTTRWVVESAALKSFMSSPANAGMGVGIGFFPSAKNLCDASSYVKPSVEIADLPGAATQLNAAISAQKPAGNTPTVASLSGAIQHATSWANAHPGRRAAVVYSTDGYPKGCPGNDPIGAASAVAKAALDSSGIQTYVLGMGQNLSSLNQIAAAGGTDQAYLIDTGKDAAAQLAQALNSIRSKAVVDCTFSIPPPPTGEALDFNKVNVRYTSSSGQVTDALRDPSPSGCNQGWQYAADKSQIDLCGDFCNSVKSDPGGSLQILFGCMTKVDIPR